MNPLETTEGFEYRLESPVFTR